MRLARDPEDAAARVELDRVKAKAAQYGINLEFPVPENNRVPS